MVCVTNPIWLVKTRLQLQVNGVGDQKHYQGFRDAVQTILKEEGVLGLYRGFIPALFLTSHGAIQFAVYEEMKIAFRTFTGEDAGKQPPWVSMAMGGLSKICASTFTYPYQVILTLDVMIYIVVLLLAMLITGCEKSFTAKTGDI